MEAGQRKKKQPLDKSMSLPQIMALGREPTVSEIVQLPFIRYSTVGGSLMATAWREDQLKILSESRSKGDLPKLKNALHCCWRDPGLSSLSGVSHASDTLKQAQKWMLICENSIHNFNAPNTGKLLRGVRELEKLNLGPQIWKDKRYPKLKKVKELAPFYPILRDLHLEHKAGPRRYAIAWQQAVEGCDLNAELQGLTANWFRDFPNARNILQAVLEDEEVRLIYARCHWENRWKLIAWVQAVLIRFHIDQSTLDIWAATMQTPSRSEEPNGEARVGVVVVITARDQLSILFRIRRVDFSDPDPEQRGRHCTMETQMQKENRIAKLLEFVDVDEKAKDTSKVETKYFFDEDALAKSTPSRKAAREALARNKALKEKLAARALEKNEEIEKKIEELRQFLINRFGSLNAAWRHALDREGNEKVSFMVFTKVLAEYGFTGSSKAIFAALDKDGSGQITFDELDPAASATLTKFEEFVLAKYGTFDKAWKAFDTDGNNLLDEAEFTDMCRELQVPGNPRKLFKSLLTKPGAKYLTLDDFVPQSFDLSLSQDPEAHLSEREKVALHLEQQQAKLSVTLDLPGLKRLLVTKYGTLAAAWKHGLDLDSNGMIHFHEFSKHVKDMGFKGNVKAMWVQLDTSKNGLISLAELDAQAADLLSEFESLVNAKYGSYMKAWSAWRLDKLTRIDESRFKAICDDLGYQGNHARLFKNLLARPGASSFNLPELDPRVLKESYLDPEQTSTLSKRERINLRKQEELARDKGVSDFKSVKTLLISLYGTMTQAWKHLLDRDGNNKISFVELCNAMREVGYKGSVKHLWKELVQIHGKGDGLLTMEVFDRDAHNALTQFRSLINDKYGGFLSAWNDLDKKEQNRIFEADFVLRCSELGYKGDPHQLFKYLLDDQSANFITLDDLDPAAAHELRLDPDRWDTALKKKNYDRQKEYVHPTEASDVPSLMRLLARKYGTITAAWRNALDLHGNDKVSFTVFCRAMRLLGFKGSVTKVWLELDADNSGQITLDELDPKAYENIMKFRELCLQKYGNFFETWKAFDIDGSQQVDVSEFCQKCIDIGYEGNARELFKNLKLEPSQRFLTFDDFDPQAAYESRLEPSRFQELDPKGRWADLQKSKYSKDMGASDFASLKRLLVRRHGTMTSAWKHCLDPGGNGKMGFVEFCKAMRQIGFIGSIRDLWKEIDNDGSGIVTLEHFDANAYRAVTSFRELVIQKHGNHLDAWKQFDQDGNGFVDETEFDDVCKSLGYEGNPGQLFRLLLDEPASRVLTLADLDVEADREATLDPERHNTRAKFEEVQREQKKHKALNIGTQATDWKTVKRTLLHQYMTITSAWKNGFDADGNNRISFVEFCQGLRDIGFKGDIKKLWSEVDINESGSVTLDEFDQTSYEMLTKYRECIRRKHGTFEAAWKAFDANRSGRIDQEEFRSGMELTDYNDDSQKLFLHLLDKPKINKHWITFDEFNCQITRKRGRHGFVDEEEDLLADSILSPLPPVVDVDVTGHELEVLDMRLSESASGNAVALDAETERKLRDVFNTCRRGDETVSKRDLIITLRNNEEVADFFGLPRRIRQEDGTRDPFEDFFQEIDENDDRELSWDELKKLYCEAKLARGFADETHVHALPVVIDADVQERPDQANLALEVENAKPFNDAAPEQVAAVVAEANVGVVDEADAPPVSQHTLLPSVHHADGQDTTEAPLAADQEELAFKDEGEKRLNESTALNVETQKEPREAELPSSQPTLPGSVNKADAHEDSKHALPSEIGDANRGGDHDADGNHSNYDDDHFDDDGSNAAPAQEEPTEAALATAHGDAASYDDGHFEEPSETVVAAADVEAASYDDDHFEEPTETALATTHADAASYDDDHFEEPTETVLAAADGEAASYDDDHFEEPTETALATTHANAASYDDDHFEEPTETALAAADGEAASYDDDHFEEPAETAMATAHGDASNYDDDQFDDDGSNAVQAKKNTAEAALAAVHGADTSYDDDHFDDDGSNTAHAQKETTEASLAPADGDAASYDDDHFDDDESNAAHAQEEPTKTVSAAADGDVANYDDDHFDDDASDAAHVQEEPTEPAVLADAVPDLDADTTRKLREVFLTHSKLDGTVSKDDLIQTLRKNREVADFFGIPKRIRQEDGTSDLMEKFLQDIDEYDNRELTWNEVKIFYSKTKAAGGVEEQTSPLSPIFAEGYDDDFEDEGDDT